MSDPRRRAHLVEVTRQVETETPLLGVSAHLLVVAQKPS